MQIASRIVVVVFFLLSSLVHASDLAKEKRWADQVVDALLDGEAVYLNDGRTDFLAIETESEDAGSRAAIVMHGTGVHPNWPTVVQPLRVRLTEAGWHTLSIQMPVLANEAEHAEYAAIYDWVPGRIDAAVDYLREKGIDTVVLAAHSQGATMSSYYLSRNPSSASAFVAIGMGATQKDSHVNSAKSLESINIPVLDLYGSEDLPGVLDTADKRKRSAAHNQGYRQLVIDGAGHFFDNENDELIEAISQWLDSL